MSRSRRHCLVASAAICVLSASTAHAQSPAPERTVAAQGVGEREGRHAQGPHPRGADPRRRRGGRGQGAAARDRRRALQGRRAGAPLGPHAGPDRVDLRCAVSPYGPFGFYSRFGPDRFCGTVRTTVFRTDKTTGKRERVGTRSRHLCQIPPTVVSTVTVTFAA